MPIRKTSLRETAGVKLVQLDELSADGLRVRVTYYRLTTLRASPVRFISGQRRALDEFDLEVVASLMDPALQRTQREDHKTRKG